MGVSSSSRTLVRRPPSSYSKCCTRVVPCTVSLHSVMRPSASCSYAEAYTGVPLTRTVLPW